MFRKLVPFVLVLFISACAQQPAGTTADVGTKAPCCEKCECCKGGNCEKCCKGNCKECCKGGTCKMCAGKHKGQSSVSADADEDCPMCLKAKKEMEQRRQQSKH